MKQLRILIADAEFALSGGEEFQPGTLDALDFVHAKNIVRCRGCSYAGPMRRSIPMQGRVFFSKTACSCRLRSSDSLVDYGKELEHVQRLSEIMPSAHSHDPVDLSEGRIRADNHHRNGRGARVRLQSLEHLVSVDVR